jgi:hypothetical protein
MVNRVLPVLYRFAVEHMVEHLKCCRSFFTSFDGWSKFGTRFVLQSYHCINPATFEYHILSLDFIHLQTPHWSEVIAGALQERIEYWTAGLDLEPIAAGGIADGAADVQSAGKRMFGDGLDGADDDMSKCQNHKMKGMYKKLEREAPMFMADMEAVAALFVSVSNSGNINSMLKAYQHVNEVSTVALYVYNDTRWEGCPKLLACALKLRLSLPCLKLYAELQKIGAHCADFLDDSFFQRLAIYHKHLAVVDNVSCLFQTQCFPAGHLVLLTYLELGHSFLPLADLEAKAQIETDFHEALHKAINDNLVDPIVSWPNAFAKAAMFHPDICWLMQHGAVSDDVLQACVSAVCEDIAVLQGENEAARALTESIFKFYLDQCKKRPVAVFPSFEALKENGVYGETDAISYWKGIGQDVGNPLAALLPIASMLLALPAGKSQNEFVFLSSGRVLMRDCNSMSPMRLEQVTVLVMFICNFGWSQQKLIGWLKKALAKVDDK